MEIKRICIDLDGVIAEIKRPDQDYSEVNAIPGAVEKLIELKKAGHYIIIHTARHMKTCQGNVGLVQARIAKKTLEWLEKNNVQYDEIFFGKPWADIYIDDNAFRFNSWEEVKDNGSNLPLNKEKQLHEK